MNYIFKTEKNYKDMSEKKFTIITVCYNAEKYIKETIDSLLEQTYEDYEYIIKDGLSTDCTLETAKDLLKHKNNIHIHSCSDKGIYDAMNQAIDMAKGEYVFFLNAGDRFYDANVLKNIKEIVDKDKPDVICGSILLEQKDISFVKQYGKIYQYSWIYLLGDCICHQALFTKRYVFDEKKFDIEYKICADRELQLYHRKNRYILLTTEYMVAKVQADGFSMQNLATYQKEVKKCLKKYYPYRVWIYHIFCWVKDNKAIHWMIEKIYRRI